MKRSGRKRQHRDIIEETCCEPGIPVLSLTCCDQTREDPALSVFHHVLLFPELLQYSRAPGPGSRWGGVLRVCLGPSAKQNSSIPVVVVSLLKERSDYVPAKSNLQHPPRAYPGHLTALTFPGVGNSIPSLDVM